MYKMRNKKGLTMIENEEKIKLLRFNFLQYYLTVLLLKHFFLIIINYYFNNLLIVFAEGVFIGILSGIYFVCINFPYDLDKMTRSCSLFFMFFDLFYGIINHTISFSIYLNLFLLPWIIYLFFPLRRTIFITISTLLIYPIDLFLRAYFEIRNHTKLYDNCIFICILIYSLILLFTVIHYYNEIKKQSILFLEREKTLETDKNLNLKIEITKYSDISCQKIFNKVDTYMQIKQPWRNADYNLEQLAKDLQLSIFQISTAINYCTKNNFKSYLNDYRLNAFAEEIKSHKNDHFLLKEVYMDLGFNSRATFNRNFKNKFRKTPQEFLSMHAI